MTWQAISAILACIGLICYEWLKNRNRQIEATDSKNQALESAADKKRAREAAEDEKLASDLSSANDPDRTIGFVLGSFRGTDKPEGGVPTTEVARPSNP